jgi:hypothetical protein
MRKGFIIYEEMRKYLVIYEEAVSHIRLCNCSLQNFLIYEENLFTFLSVCQTDCANLEDGEDICTLYNPMTRGASGGGGGAILQDTGLHIVVEAKAKLSAQC